MVQKKSDSIKKHAKENSDCKDGWWASEERVKGPKWKKKKAHGLKASKM
jgi:hypothetical protein